MRKDSLLRAQESPSTMLLLDHLEWCDLELEFTFRYVLRTCELPYCSFSGSPACGFGSSPLTIDVCRITHKLSNSKQLIFCESEVQAWLSLLLCLGSWLERSLLLSYLGCLTKFSFLQPQDKTSGPWQSSDAGQTWLFSSSFPITTCSHKAGKEEKLQ